MTWFKVDDSLAFHHKTVQAGNTAIGLWVRAGSWSAQQLTDGHVPQHMVSVLGSQAQADRLVAAGLWIQEAEGYRFHEWSENGRQPSRSEILARRKIDAEKKAYARAAKTVKTQVDGPRPQGTNEGLPEGLPEGVRSTRPDPTRKEEKTTSSLPRKRGSRIPDDFTVTPEMVEWARLKVPGIDGRTETEKFVNYWQAKSGKDATKLDWAATWRNWMLNAKQRAPTQKVGKDAKIAYLQSLKQRTHLAIEGDAS